MNKELIVSTENTLGGSPRLDGHLLAVWHVMWWLTMFGEKGLQSYEKTFNVNPNQIRHAILHCKDEICKVNKVAKACLKCSKKFKNDSIKEPWVSAIDKDGWKNANALYKTFKNKINLPDSYAENLKELDKT